MPDSDSPSAPGLPPADHASLSLLPFFNTTYSLARVSPLHIGPERLSAKRLNHLASRLRDTLVGDTVRGVQIGSGPDSGLGRAGNLKEVLCRLVAVGSFLGNPDDDEGRAPSRDMGSLAGDGGDDEDERARREALWIEIRYESARCSAILLPSLSKDASRKVGRWAETDRGKRANSSHFMHLPLLLLRMPAPLKAVISDFLCSVFDCRISPLKLGTRSMVQTWEAWLQHWPVGTAKTQSKESVVTLGFYIAPEPSEGGEQEELGLRTIDIVVPGDDLGRFVTAGEGLESSGVRDQMENIDDRERRRLAGGTDEEGWHWRLPAGSAATVTVTGGTAPRRQQPFTEALGLYLDRHLSLKLFHPGVRIVKISCPAFVVSEGKVKVFADGEDEEGRAIAPGGAWRCLAGLSSRAEAVEGIARDGVFG